MSTGCAFYEEALADQLSDRLGADRARELEAHLRSCPECSETRAVLEAVRGATVPAPEGLERRIRDAVRAAAAGPTAPMGAPGTPARTGRRSWSWRPVALPLAAAAALAALWVGTGLPGGDAPVEPEPIAAEEVEPFGAWPAADGAVAGDVLLSELTEEELERLLEEMES